MHRDIKVVRLVLTGLKVNGLWGVERIGGKVER